MEAPNFKYQITNYK